MIIFGKPPQEPPPPPVTRNKTGVANLVKSKAPANEKHDLAWWLEWLRQNW